jgi:AbiV
MAVSDASLRAIAVNAVRHLLEADQHYKAGRFPSATTSAVLSIEEAGKLSFLTAHGFVPKVKRHAAHAMLFLGLLKALGSWGWTADWAKIIRGEADPADLGLTAQQQQDIAAHPELAEFVRRVEAGELSDLAERNQALGAAVVAKERREGTFQPWDSLFANGLQAIRLKATYVDVTEAGDVQTDVNTFADESMAKFMCTGAVSFLVVALLLAMYTRKSLEVQDLVGSVPDDVTGLDVLLKWTQRLFPYLKLKELAEAVSMAA